MGTKGRLPFPRAFPTVIVGLVAAFGGSATTYAAAAAPPSASSCVLTRISGAPGPVTALAGSSPTDVWALVKGTPWWPTTMFHFDGTSWSLVTIPVAGQLNAVIALSPTNAWAVGGGASGALIEHWDGTQWRVVPSRNPLASSHAILNGIAAASATDIWAVGSYFNTAFNGSWALTEHWDGSRWHIVPSRHPSTNTWLNAVTVIASNDVWAVGGASGVLGSSSLFEHWDGLSWSWLRQPNGPSLDSVSAASSTDVWALGTIHSATDQAIEPLFEHWDGRAWRVAPWKVTFSPTGRPGVGSALVLFSVVAFSHTSVFAAGEMEGEFSLLGHWDGSQWIVDTGFVDPATGMDTTAYAAASVGGLLWLAGFELDTRDPLIWSCAV